MPRDHNVSDPSPCPDNACHFGFAEEDWCTLSGEEQHAFRHCGAWLIPNTGATIAEIVAMVSANADLRPSVVSIFIAWLEGERAKWREERNSAKNARLKTPPPFLMSDERWLWINSLRVDRSLAWIDADQWERISETVRGHLAVGVLPPGTAPATRVAPTVEPARDACIAEADEDDDDCGDMGDPETTDDGGLHHALPVSATMPTWRPGSQATPNTLARSSTFAVIEKGKRRTLGKDGSPESIAAWSGVQIQATGVQLCQADHCTFQALISRAKLQSRMLDKPIEFDPRVLLREMGRQTSRWNREWLSASITRLAGLRLSVRSKGREFHGTLVKEFRPDAAADSIQVIMNSDVVKLFADGAWTQLPRTFRQALIGHPLAAWLTTFFGSHATSTGIRVDKLMKLSGSRCKRERLFRRRLTVALDACITASEAGQGEIIDYKFANELVYVSKNGSRTQERYVARKTRGRPRSIPEMSSIK